MTTISTINLYARSLATRNSGVNTTRNAAFADVSAKATSQPESNLESATKPQTLDEFKQEFHQFIDSIPIHPGASGTKITVNISDAAFERMMNEPEFEEKIKGLFVRDLCDPSLARSPRAAYMDIRVDASGGEYLARSGGNGLANPSQSRSDDSFWHRDSVKKNAADEKAKQKKEDTRLFLERLAEKRLQDKKESAEYFMSLSATAYVGLRANSDPTAIETLA